MRLYPKVNRDKTVFQVRRLSASFPERKVLFNIGLRTRLPRGDECYEYYWNSLQENDSWSQYGIGTIRDEYVPDGRLTVMCCMRLREESRAGSSAQGEEEQGGFSGRNASFSSQRSPAKMELSTEFPCTRVYFNVRNVFELLRETGDSLTSPEFRFAGDTYCFRFEANGDTAGSDLRLVRMTSTCTENAVYYRVGYWYARCPTYSNNSVSLVDKIGFCVSRSTLVEERVKYLSCGNLSLVLFLHLGEQSSAGAGTSDAAQKETGLKGIPKLQSDFRQILQKGTESDACVVVQGKEFPVHRVVLRARSTIFEAMFKHDMAEKKTGRVVIDDLDPDTFGDFLEYLYTGVIPARLSNDNAFELYSAADKYDVSTLKSECVEHMRRTLSVDSFSDVVTVALQHHEQDLLQHAISFYKDNVHRIFISEKWQQFNLDNGASVNEFLRKAYSPETQ